MGKWGFGEGKEQTPVAINSRLIVNTAEAAIDAAIDGLGVTRVLSYQVASAVANGKLEIIMQDFEPSPLPVNIIYLGGLIPQKLRAFIDFAAPRLKVALSACDG